ncbi:MAG: hypothetical protein ACOX4O_09625 [Eubacteriales bacterium]|jgi:hypothetical protein
MRFLRFTAFVLAIVLAVSVFVSCGKPPSSSKNETDNLPAAEISDTEAEETTLGDGLPDIDFGGADFTIAVRNSRLDDFFTEEETGEIKNDAVFARNRAVEERFGITLHVVDYSDDWNSGLRAVVNNSLLAADGAFDIVVPDYWWGCETLGAFTDLLTLNYLDFDRPWWCHGWNQNVRILNKLYTAVGDYTLDMIRNQEVVFFNKRMVEDYSLGNIYETVSVGKWTLDKLNLDIAAVSADLNGDGKMTSDADCFGASFGLHSGRNLFYSFGLRLASADEEGRYHYDYYNDRFENLYSGVHKLINLTDGVDYNKMSVEQIMSAMNENRLLYWFANVRNAETLRSLDADFGIIPTPKFDENQESYISSNLGTSYFAIPNYITDTDRAAIILEALNYESHRLVRPAYYDIVLKAKGTRDEDSEKMLDLVMDVSYIDFVFVNAAALDYAAEAVFDAIIARRDSYASSYEKRQNKDNKLMEKLMDSYAEMN